MQSKIIINVLRHPMFEKICLIRNDLQENATSPEITLDSFCSKISKNMFTGSEKSWQRD